MKISDPAIHHALSFIKRIARSVPGRIAGTCGEALAHIAGPLAQRVVVELEGLAQDSFESGKNSDLKQIHRIINDYKMADLRAERRFPDYLSISTDDDRLVSIAVVKHLGNPVALVAALSDLREESILPFEESVYIVASQLGARIHALLSPGSRNAMEITGRRMLTELTEPGVKGICICSMGEPDKMIALYPAGKEIVRSEVEPESRIDISMIKNGDALSAKDVKLFWPNGGVGEAIWITDLPGFLVAAAFSKKEEITKQVKAAIKSAVEKLAVADADYIMKSFEKLKADFKKLMKSERAAAVTETAVTVNHEINNPLTAILGNTQLLLMNEESLPKDVVTKLKTIERSAIQIRETTAKLMTIVEAVRTPYASGLDMIDIEGSKKKQK